MTVVKLDESYHHQIKPCIVIIQFAFQNIKKGLMYNKYKLAVSFLLQYIKKKTPSSSMTFIM
jgi:hypothetical protein